MQVVDVVTPDRLLPAAEELLIFLDDPRVRLDLCRAETLKDPADRIAGHEPRQQEGQRQRDPDGKEVEAEATYEPAHRCEDRIAAGGRGTRGPPGPRLLGVSRDP